MPINKNLMIDMNNHIIYYVIYFNCDGTYGLFKKSACRVKGGNIVSVGYGSKVYDGVIQCEGIASILLFFQLLIIFFTI